LLFDSRLLYIRSVSRKLCNTSNGQHVAAPASPLKQLHSPAQLAGASSPRPVPEDLGRYRFQVVAANVADAVISIGGLIFDRAMSGWDVSVLLDGDNHRGTDDRPIRILGGRVTTLMAGLNRAGMVPRPQMLAVATDVMVKSEAVRRLVLAARTDSATEVLLWGRHHPPNLNCRFVPVRHRPSAAAHVFKSHALAAGEAFALHLAEEGFYSMA
jgi:hypothetical protein